MATQPDFIEGNFATFDPVSAYLQTFPGETVAAFEDPLANKRVETLHNTALSTVIAAPHSITNSGEGYRVIETDPIPYIVQRFSGHVSLKMGVMLPNPVSSESELLVHAQSELSPVTIVAGPGLQRQHDSDIFHLAPTHVLRTFSGLSGPGSIQHATSQEKNYVESLLRKMRKVWGVSSDNKK